VHDAGTLPKHYPRCRPARNNCKSDSTRPGPPVFIATGASRSLPRLLRALPAQPSREAARRYRLAERVIKHDGFRMLVRRDAAGVWLFTRNGHDWTGRFPLIARAALSLRAVSCLIDGEAVACDDDGAAGVRDRLRYRRDDRRVFPLRLRPPPAFLPSNGLNSFISPAPASCTTAHPCASGTTRRSPAPLQSA